MFLTKNYMKKTLFLKSLPINLFFTIKKLHFKNLNP